MWDACRDIFCGTVAGVVGKLAGYPFDTIKVRLQVEGHPYKGTMDCVLRVAKEEGLRGFYNGITAPIAGAAFENAGVFVFYGRGVAAYQYATGTVGQELPLDGIILAGAFSGLATATVLTPVELLKSRVQIEQQTAAAANRAPKYRGVFDCGMQVLRTSGFKALFDGYSATLVREIPGNACWFGFYEMTLRKVFMPAGKTKKEDCPWYAFPIAGGAGGLGYWSALFPADTVKTRMQLDPMYQKLGLVKGLQHLYRQGGVRALYKGYAITACRAIPANATIFSAYEFTMKQWKRYVEKKNG